MELLQLPAPVGVDFDLSPEVVLHVLEAAQRPISGSLNRASVSAASVSGEARAAIPPLACTTLLDAQFVRLIHHESQSEPFDAIAAYSIVFAMCTCKSSKDWSGDSAKRFLYEKYMPAVMAEACNAHRAGSEGRRILRKKMLSTFKYLDRYYVKGTGMTSATSELPTVKEVWDDVSAQCDGVRQNPEEGTVSWASESTENV